MSGSASFQRARKSCVRSFGLGRVAGEYVGAADLQPRKGPDRLVHHDAGMVENLLELTNRGRTLMRRQIGFTANVNWVERKVLTREWSAQFWRAWIAQCWFETRVSFQEQPVLQDDQVNECQTHWLGIGG